MSSLLSPRIVVRMLVALAIAAVVATAGLLITGRSESRADACVASSVAVRTTKQDMKLTSPLRLQIYATCDDDPYSITARGYLYVAGHRTGRLHTLKVQGITVGSPRTMTIEVPCHSLTETRAYARRHHRRKIVLKFVVRATGNLNGRDRNASASYSRLRL